MVAAVAIKTRKARERLGIGMPGDNARIIEVARSLCNTVDACRCSAVSRSISMAEAGRPSISIFIQQTGD